MDDPTLSAMLERATEPMPADLLTTTIDGVRQELVDEEHRRGGRSRRGWLLGVSASIAALAVLIAGVAIAFRDEGDRVVDTGPASTITTSTTSTPPPDADVPLTGTPLAEAPSKADCPPPFAPLVSVDQYSGSTAQLPVLAGENVFSRDYRDPQVDSDGDGTPDEIAPKNKVTDPASLSRGDGSLTFERADRIVSVVGLPDLDGDGRDDLGVGVYELTDTSPSPLVAFYVVPGSTEPGTHDPADVGIRVARSVGPVPDRDGDGVDELLEYDAQSPTRILSGAAVGATAAPGDARSVEPLLFVPGSLIGFADLDDGPPAVVTGELVRSPETAGIVRIATDEGVYTFTTAPEPWVAGYTALIEFASVVVSDRGTFIVVSQSERTAARSYLWRLDAPCTPL